MRVVMVAPSFPLHEGSVSGGTAAASYYLCRALRDSGEVELDIVRPNAPGGMRHTITIDGMQVHPLSRPKYVPHLCYVLRAARQQTCRAVASLKPDVIHTQDHTLVRATANSVATLHGIGERDALFSGNRFTRRLRSFVVYRTLSRTRDTFSNVIAISPYTVQHLRPNGRRRVWHIPNPVPDAYFTIRRNPEPGRVLCASRIIERKNIEGLIQAFSEVIKVVPAASLRLAGALSDEAYATRCRSLAERLGILDGVHFLGLLSIEELQKELTLARAFALGSFEENAPVSVAEAMAAGVPVVASKVGGVPWMLREGALGRLVDPNDLSSVSEALVDVLLSPSADAIAAEANAVARQTYHSRVVAKKTLEVYRHVRTLGQ